MLVYGDHSEQADSAQKLDAISSQLAAVSNMPAGIDRHAALVGALIEAGRLLQGLDDKGRQTEELSAFVHDLAKCAVTSLDSRFASLGSVPSPPRLTFTEEVELRVPEGFAFYAVYPEAYAEAARKLKLAGCPIVIGIRSIGTTLGAIVAVALGSAPAVTVRPTGDPFAREVELSPEIVVPDAHYVVVDEGPGLSGSSFGAVADWLEAHGVPLERIAFLPSHSGGLGPEASDRHRQRWTRAQKVTADFNSSFLEERFGPLKEFAGGGAWQRRKFIGSFAGNRVLLKFAGLGAIGQRKLDMARALHAAGFTAEPLGLVHGFLIERWLEDAEPLAEDSIPVAKIGRYIGARARLFPAAPDSGASIGELLAMCRRNIGVALGEADTESLMRFDPAALAPRARRVRTDNKLNREEWLRLPAGRLIKTDALDHHQGHDLIGCQGVEWDIAGATEELALRPEETAELIASSGLDADGDLLAFYRIAYAAFRLGQSSLAGEDAVAAGYRNSLQLLLHQES